MKMTVFYYLLSFHWT